MPPDIDVGVKVSSAIDPRLPMVQLVAYVAIAGHGGAAGSPLVAVVIATIIGMTSSDPAPVAQRPEGQRKRRANGEESRRRIIEAAAEIASERGYEGTSISTVSERSGLPSSSIYWHFADKDDLIAAVIEHSFERWRELMAASLDRTTKDPGAALAISMRKTGEALRGAPDFLRLGLMLALERRPQEPRARTRYLEARRTTRHATEEYYRSLFPATLDGPAIEALALLAMAATDGLFVAGEVDGAGLDTAAAFELVGVALNAVAQHLAARRRR